MNELIFFFFYNLAHQSDFFDNIVIFTSVYFPFVVVFLAGVFLVMHHEILKAEEPFKVFMQKKKEIFLVFSSGFLAWIIAIILKILIHAPRPFDVFLEVRPLFSPSDFAFPSGHATFF